jgi:hypothetical protein
MKAILFTMNWPSLPSSEKQENDELMSKNLGWIGSWLQMNLEAIL